MSILVKAGTGLAAGVIAGVLGLAFLPRVEPTAVQPRKAVEKPQFVAAPASTPESVASTRAAPALAIASEATPAKPKPAPEAEAKPAAAPPKPAEAAETKPAPSALAAIAMAKLDPPKAPPSPSLGQNRTVSFAPVGSVNPAPAAPAAAAPQQAMVPPAPAAAPQQALVPPAPAAAPPLKPASEDAARWSVRGLVALAKGDLSSARLYLNRAAEAGDARALVALADTYDPAMLAKFGVVMAPGDAQKAREYLVKAAAAGVVVSKDRMAALDPDLRGN